MYKIKKSYRLYGYDYAASGYYHITIVTKERVHYFGEIQHGEMKNNLIADFTKSNILNFIYDSSLDNPYENNFYFKTKSNYIISIDEWVIMPNHLHLLIEIINNNSDEPKLISGITPLVTGSISSFVNHFKGKIKRYANENNIEFAWHSRFHDRIIRDTNEYYAVKQYIKDNIKNYSNDVELQ